MKKSIKLSHIMSTAHSIARGYKYKYKNNPYIIRFKFALIEAHRRYSTGEIKAVSTTGISISSLTTNTCQISNPRIFSPSSTKRISTQAELITHLLELELRFGAGYLVLKNNASRGNFSNPEYVYINSAINKFISDCYKRK